MAKNKILKKSNERPEPQNSLYINNTYQNFNVNVLPTELSALLHNDPDFVKEYLKKEQIHRHDAENQILELEKIEQDIRKTEIPHYRRFAFTGQILSYATIFGCLGIAGYGLYTGGVGVALSSILVAAITVTPQLIGAYQAKKAGKDTSRAHSEK